MCDCCGRELPVNELRDDEGVEMGCYCDHCIPASELVLSGPFSVFVNPLEAA